MLELLTLSSAAPRPDPQSMDEPPHCRVPPLPPRYLRRPRLTRLLDDSTAQAIILYAPAGYGKTCLASEWLQGRTDVAWYSAHPATADLATFARDVARVAAHHRPGTQDRIADRIRVGDPPDQTARPLAELVSDGLSSLDNPPLFVLDGYEHSARSPAVETFVDWLLVLNPGLRIICTTRRRPAWASARRSLSGELLEIRHEQLVLTHDESETLIRQTGQVRTDGLVTSIRGWPAALAVAATSRGEATKETATEGVYRYLTDEVLHREDTPMREFMLRTSLLPRFSHEDAARLAGDSATVASSIDDLLDSGLLQPGGNGRFHYHPLLQQFLVHVYRNQRGDDSWNVLDRELENLIVSRQWNDALSVAMTFGDPDVIARTIGRTYEGLLEQGLSETLQEALDRCRHLLAYHPELLLASAELALRANRLPECLGIARRASELDPRQRSVRSRALTLASRAERWLSNESSALALAQDALQCATTDRERIAALAGALYASLEVDQSLSDDILGQLEAIGTLDPSVRTGVSISKVVLGLRRGDISALDQELKAASPIEAALDPLSRTSLLSARGYLAAQGARYELARDHATAALATIESFSLRTPRIFIHQIRALAAIGLRDLNSAISDYRLAKTIAASDDDSTVDLIVDIMASRLRIASADLGSPPTLNSEAAGTVAPHFRGELWALAALEHALNGDSSTACRYAEHALSMTSGLETWAAATAATLIVASDEPGAKLDQRCVDFIVECGRRGALDIVVQIARSQAGLLKYAAADAAALSVIERALIRSCDYDRLVDVQRGSILSTLSPLQILTPRETEVLSLIGAGNSNSAIARQLYIAPGTVKTHVTSIMRKLDVRNRVQAALVWQRHAGKSD